MQKIYFLLLELIILKQFISKLFGFKVKNKSKHVVSKPKTATKMPPNNKNMHLISRSEHSISRKQISEHALKVLYRLNKQGYDAYLVGGCVRDLLLNKTPKDFDIATSATPEQVKRIFSNSRIIGRRFKIVHVIFGREIIEVSTFRSKPTPNHKQSNNRYKAAQSGMIMRDNTYGTIEQDALRRDFTINSLYYSVKDFAIRDFCNGYTDLQNKTIKLIGDPKTRYQEDPVRMLRAIRFKAKLDMQMDAKTQASIKELSSLMQQVSAARLFDESIKLLQSGHGFKTYQLLKEYQLLGALFPSLKNEVNCEDKPNYISQTGQLITQTLKNTDYRISQNKNINPAFLFAAMLWYPLQEQTKILLSDGGLSYHDAFDVAMHDVLAEQCKAILIPKRFSSVMFDIWRMQLHFNKRTVKRILSIYSHNKFRAAYDLLELRAGVENGKVKELALWWDEFQHAEETEQSKMLASVKNDERRHYKRSYKSNRKVNK